VPLSGRYELTLRYRVPTISNDPLAPRLGLLLSYGEDYARALVRFPDYIDKILRGAKPSELPITQPTKLDLVINLKTARAIGVTVPPTLLGRADEVINEGAFAAVHESGSAPSRRHQDTRQRIR